MSSLANFAVKLGLDPNKDSDLMWIVEEALQAPLPEGWTQHESSKGDPYYYNSISDESTRKHPLEDYYREICAKHLKTKTRPQTADAADVDEGEKIDFLGVTPDEVVEMAIYFQIDPQSEFHLLQLARQAVVAPLPSHWIECHDRQGQVYYYNTKTDVSTREHPVDKHFRQMIAEARNDAELVSPTGSWMIFLDSNASYVYHDFQTGITTSQRPQDLPPNSEELQRRVDREFMRLQLETPNYEEEDQEAMLLREARRRAEERAKQRVPTTVVEDANSPRTTAIRDFLQDVGEKAEQQIRGWIESGEMSTAGLALEGPKRIANPPPPAAHARVPKPSVLVFYSWWFEERQRRYMELQFSMKTQLFKIILDKTIVLKDVKIAGKNGELLAAFDLFVGQKIDVLGKPTTLMQGSLATIEWLEYHANKLLKKAAKLEDECSKFTPMNQTIHKMLNGEKGHKKGSRNLRWILRQIDALHAILDSFKRPEEGGGGEGGAIDDEEEDEEGHEGEHD